MITITFSNGNKLELSVAEALELNKGINFAGMPISKSMKVPMQAKVSTPAAVKQHGVKVAEIKSHYKNYKINAKHKIYKQEQYHVRRYGKYSWEM